MANVNTQSVREEAARIKTEFEQLFADKNIDKESKMLFQSMLMLIHLLISIFLEKTTTKNNKNSSKPYSETEKDESAIGNTITNGKGKKEHVDAEIKHCPDCDSDVKGTFPSDMPGILQ